MTDEPSNGELRRIIERNHIEDRDDYQSILDRLDKFVLREVYRSDELRRVARFEVIEARLERSSSSRMLMATLAITAFIAPIVTGIIVYLVVKGMK